MKKAIADTGKDTVYSLYVKIAYAGYSVFSKCGNETVAAGNVISLL